MLDHARGLSGEYIGGADLIYAAFGGHHRALDGISAQGKEIIVDADVLHAENILEGGAKDLLHIGFRRDILILEAARLGGQKGAPVQLAIGVDRQLVQLHKERREHIGRQLPGDGFLQLVRVHRFTFHIVGHQIDLAVLVLEILERRVADPRGLPDDRFDLSGLHALAVDLYHPVLAVEVDDVAVPVPSDDVAGPQ